MSTQLHPNAIQQAVQALSDQGFDGMAQAMELLLNECMKVERQQALGVGPYQRGEARRGQANGFKPKQLKTRVGPLNLRVPQVRGAEFYPSVLERGSRSEKALRLALAEMYVQGVSTRKVSQITEELCGCEISSSDVSRATALLDEELTKWRTRPLGAIKYHSRRTIREGPRGGLRARLCGFNGDWRRCRGTPQRPRRKRVAVGSRSPLARVSQEPARAGLHGLELIVSDAHAGLKEARQACLGSVPWQRCQFHLLHNALQHVPKDDLKREVVADVRSVLDAPDLPAAQERLQRVVSKYEKTAPEAGRLARSQRAGESHGAASADIHPPTASPHHQHAGTAQPRTQTPHPRRHALSQRRLAATIGDRRPD